jgi:hypothetical protein
MEGGHRVGQKQDLVLVDTNIFVIDLQYKRDINYETNRAFLNDLGCKEASTLRFNNGHLG